MTWWSGPISGFGKSGFLIGAVNYFVSFAAVL
jgi:hypothetical protein